MDQCELVCACACVRLSKYGSAFRCAKYVNVYGIDMSSFRRTSTKRWAFATQSRSQLFVIWILATSRLTLRRPHVVNHTLSCEVPANPEQQVPWKWDSWISPTPRGGLACSCRTLLFLHKFHVVYECLLASYSQSYHFEAILIWISWTTTSGVPSRKRRINGLPQYHELTGVIANVKQNQMQSL